MESGISYWKQVLQRGIQPDYRDEETTVSLGILFRWLIICAPKKLCPITMLDFLGFAFW